MQHKSAVDQSAGASRQDRRRVAILDAAEELFLERGFEAVTLSGVVSRSGGSLATLYALFGNKTGLLRAVIERARGDDIAEMDRMAAEMGTPADVLMALGRHIHASLDTPRQLALFRIVLAESLRDPSFARSFHERVRMPFVAHLAGLFERWTEAGLASIDRSLDASEQFLSLVMQGEIGALCCAEAGLRPDDDDGLRWRIAPFLSHYRVAGYTAE